MSRSPRSRNTTVKVTGSVAAIAAIVVGAISLWPSVESFSSDLLNSRASDFANPVSPAGVDAPPVEIRPDGDYFEVIGAAELRGDAQIGEITYCPLDELGRTTCAYGYLTSELRAEARATDREDILVDPSGWPSRNDEVTIPALDLEGSADYRGWFWKRSHLIADSLGGNAVVSNLVTGTRTQNVGSTKTDGQYGGGMAYTELIARDYLDTHDGDACPLYYGATPQYSGDEPIPRTVLVDIQNCDKKIDLRVEVSNTANSWVIDYTTGAYSAG